MAADRAGNHAAALLLLLLAACAQPGAALFGFGDDSEWIRDTTRPITTYSEPPTLASTQQGIGSIVLPPLPPLPACSSSWLLPISGWVLLSLPHALPLQTS